MTDLLNWRVWAAVMVAIALAASHWKAYKLGGADVRLEWAADVLSQSEQTNQIQTEVARVNAALQADADKLRKAKNAQIDRLNADLATALDGLRNRPERPGEGDLPEPAGAGPEASCTGAGLYKQDAGFLVREAARGKRLQLDLSECQARYESARNSMK